MLGHEAVEAEVRHHRDGDDVDAERQREHGEDLVAVERLAALVDGEHPIAVPVEGHPEVEALACNGLLQGREIRRSAADVDVGPVRARLRSRSPRRRVARTREVRATRKRRSRSRPRCGARSDRSRSARRSSSRSALRPLRRGSLEPPPGAGASSNDSIASSSSSESLWPWASKNFTPLYSGGLCEAEITAPRSSTSRATAGVGRTPASSAVPPAATIPRASASSSTPPDARVSRPTRTRPPPDQSVGRLAESFDEVERQVLAEDPANPIGAEVTPAHPAPTLSGEASLAPTPVREATASRTEAPCAPCAGRPSCARRCEHRA